MKEEGRRPDVSTDRGGGGGGGGRGGGIHCWNGVSTGGG